MYPVSCTRSILCQAPVEALRDAEDHAGDAGQAAGELQADGEVKAGYCVPCVLQQHDV